VLASVGLAWAVEASELAVWESELAVWESELAVWESELAVWESETPSAVAWEAELGRERA